MCREGDETVLSLRDGGTLGGGKGVFINEISSKKYRSSRSLKAKTRFAASKGVLSRQSESKTFNTARERVSKPPFVQKVPLHLSPEAFISAFLPIADAASEVLVLPVQDDLELPPLRDYLSKSPDPGSREGQLYKGEEDIPVFFVRESWSFPRSFKPLGSRRGPSTAQFLNTPKQFVDVKGRGAIWWRTEKNTFDFCTMTLRKILM